MKGTISYRSHLAHLLTLTLDCFLGALAVFAPLAAGAQGTCNNLWNIKYFGCDCGHDNNFILQRDGTPVCGSGNCPGAPNTCWINTIPQHTNQIPGVLSWTIDSFGALQLSQGQDNQVYGDTFLYVTNSRILTVPFSADVGRVWLNNADVTESGPSGYVTLNLITGWNHLEWTSYNQNQGTVFQLNFPFALQVERMNTSTNECCPDLAPPTVTLSSLTNGQEITEFPPLE